MLAAPSLPAHAGDYRPVHAVQQVGDLRISLQRIETTDETVTIWFEVLNEGPATTEIALAAAGYAHNGTYLKAGGRKIVARQIAIAGFYGDTYLKTDYAPGIPKEGLLVFEGWDGDLGELTELGIVARGRAYWPIRLTYDLRP